MAEGSTTPSGTRGQWGSRLGFVLAASGSAVGLGNIWKFPYITGENGGGWFVLIYLVCIALVGVPILMGEIMIGRAAQKQPVGAFHVLQGRPTSWSIIGWMGVLAGLIILSFYVVVAGWAMDYTLKSVVNFTNPMLQEAEGEALQYRATADVSDMRETLIDLRVERNTTLNNEISAIRNEAPPSVWETYNEFEAAIADAQNQQMARTRLLADSEIQSVVEQAEPLVQRIEAARAEARDQASTTVHALTEQQVRKKAATEKKRQLMADKVSGAFGALASDGWTSTFWSAIFMLITILIVAGGVSGGIERACRVLMPTLMVLIIVMVIYGMFQQGFPRALAFVFKPEAGKLEPSGVLEALGHAFFTLSLGMGAMITYGSYQRTGRGLAGESVTIAALDTAIALLACLMMFPIIFSYDLPPEGGPGLVFMSMPLAFAEIGAGGMFLAIIFFGLLVFAALTSAISLLEVVASYFIDQRGWARRKAAWIMGGVILLVAIPSAFSNDPEFAMTGWRTSYGNSFFDTMDYLTSNWMLPLGGLLISLYAGWVMPRRLQEAQVEGLAPMLFMGWLTLVRFIAPALVIIVLLQKIGLLDANELLHGVFH